MDAPRLDRLRLTDKVVAAMAQACREIAAQNDPVGGVDSMWRRPNGLLVGRMRIPLGVIAMIYESRPNVTVDSGALCLKAGNAVILRGGSEAFHSNQCLAGLVHRALAGAGLPEDAVQLVPTTDRAAVSAMLKLDRYIDVIIPRGGEGLIRAVVAEATMPVLKHYKGVCHAYVDAGADQEQALEVEFQRQGPAPGRVHRPGGAVVHADEAALFLPLECRAPGAAGVSPACPRALPLLAPRTRPAGRTIRPGVPRPVLAVRVVDSKAPALDHIATYGSNTRDHSDRDHGRAPSWVREADSLHGLGQRSSRFNETAELGLCAAIGISTSKLHPTGPWAPRKLTAPNSWSTATTVRG
jgi:glutamate-5-semialdehyde dehydrogenase